MPRPPPPPPFPPIPSGPYISFAHSSKAVTLREPSDGVCASAACHTEQTACPHAQAGLLDWHSASSWPGGNLPAAGADVSLPAGSRVLISRTVDEHLGLITIPLGSELIIGSQATAIRLDATGIAVYGALRAGSETCRLQTPVEISLHGSRKATRAARDAQPAWAKGIFVSGGTLELHGKLYHRTWARLARSVEAGDQIILLQAAVNWEAGQKIVLVTSALKDDRTWHRNEVVSVAKVATAMPSGAALPVGVGAAVLLASAAQYVHEANENYQVEVGLLSRTITVQGADDDSEPVDQTPLSCTDSQTILDSRTVPCPASFLTGYGGHILASGSAAVARVEGVELFRMGQTNVLGRYPMHFHLLGAGGASSYIRDSSIHRSYYRGVSIHGTHSVSVSRNVAYDVTGYCYYIEDGVEELNVRT